MSTPELNQALVNACAMHFKAYDESPHEDCVCSRAIFEAAMEWAYGTEVWAVIEQKVQRTSLRQLIKQKEEEARVLALQIERLKGQL